MRIRGSRIGLAFILTGILLTRIAIHFSHLAPSMTPEEIWHGMSSGLQAIVLVAFCLIIYGCRNVLRSIVMWHRR
jgi:hypothetical protein